LPFETAFADYVMLRFASDLGEFAGVNDDDLAAILFDDSCLSPSAQSSDSGFNGRPCHRCQIVSAETAVKDDAFLSSRSETTHEHQNQSGKPLLDPLG
jgi:hypothetical protein